MGGLLAKAALDWAAGRKNLKEIGGDQADSDGVHGQQHVVLSCTFLKRWHQLNPIPEHIAVVVNKS